MSKNRSDKEKQAIIDRLEKLPILAQQGFTHSATLEAIQAILVEKGICTQEELDNEFYEILDKRIQ